MSQTSVSREPIVAWFQNESIPTEMKFDMHAPDPLLRTSSFLFWEKLWIVNFSSHCTQRPCNHCHFHQLSITGGDCFEQNPMPCDYACQQICLRSNDTQTCMSLWMSTHVLYSSLKASYSHPTEGTNTDSTPVLVIWPWRTLTFATPKTSTPWYMVATSVNTKMNPVSWPGLTIQTFRVWTICYNNTTNTTGEDPNFPSS